MKILQMPSYISGNDEYIISSRIIHFKAIDYNGRAGTVITLDTGKEITTNLSVFKVEEMLKNLV